MYKISTLPGRKSGMMRDDARAHRDTRNSADRIGFRNVSAIAEDELQFPRSGAWVMMIVNETVLQGMPA